MSLAFRQAGALSEALASGALEAYQAEHSRLARQSRLMSNLLLMLDRFPLLRRGALRAMAFEPRIFAGMLARHLGQTGQVSVEEHRVVSAPPRID